MKPRSMMEAEVASITSPYAPYLSKMGRAKIPTSSPPKFREKSVDDKSATGRRGKIRRTLSILSNSSFLP